MLFSPTMILPMCLLFVIISSLVLYAITRLILGRQTKIDNTFWEHQALAKSKIIWLNMLFFFMLILLFITTFILSYIVLSLVQYEFYSSYKPLDFLNRTNKSLEFNYKNYIAYFYISFFCAIALIAIVLVAYVFKSFSLRNHSIDKLASMLQAKEIDPLKVQPRQERMLLEVIQEMAIASNMPMPRVFVMYDEDGINAMCSGERFGKSDERIAIFVTKGALTHFNREELQGVIGHEFSHAFHKDVALNLKIFSLVFGLNCVMMVGQIMIRAATKGRMRSNDSKKSEQALFFIVLVFLVLGFVGSVFAKIIQAAISRQKEFLADASSVQYTRNPNGIKQALYKLLILQQENQESISKIDNIKAQNCAHMFFLEGFKGIFSTHPPLEKRIQHIDIMG